MWRISPAQTKMLKLVSEYRTYDSMNARFINQTPRNVFEFKTESYLHWNIYIQTKSEILVEGQNVTYLCYIFSSQMSSLILIFCDIFSSYNIILWYIILQLKISYIFVKCVTHFCDLFMWYFSYVYDKFVIWNFTLQNHKIYLTKFNFQYHMQLNYDIPWIYIIGPTNWTIIIDKYA